MNLNIQVGEIVMDGVRLTESQLFELRLALESELSHNLHQIKSHNYKSASDSHKLSVELRPDSTPRQIASQVSSSIGSTVSAQANMQGNQS